MTDPTRLIYLGNVRLPTEKAHGWQIVKMCEAFASQGLSVELWHPRRKQQRVEHKAGLFDYYGVPVTFKVRTLSNLDVFALERLVPKSVFRGLFYLHALIWGAFAAMIARRAGADVYYTRDPILAFWLTRMRLSVVYEPHTVPARVGRWFVQRLTKKAPHLVVALTRSIFDELHELGLGHSRCDMIVLPDAVDLEMFAELADRDDCRTRLGIPLQSRIVGYIGRFHTMEMEKGIRELIHAVAQISAEVPATILCVGGPLDRVPDYMAEARNVGLTEDRIIFVDRVPNQEVPAWIKVCDVVAIPWPRTRFSEYYTSPLKLFEYMAAGVPIVASDLTSLREVLENDSNALLVEPGDPQELARALRRLLLDEPYARELAHRALQDVKSHTWDARAREILVSYRSATSVKRSQPVES